VKSVYRSIEVELQYAEESFRLQLPAHSALLNLQNALSQRFGQADDAVSFDAGWAS
jgi:hypothetical protein